MITTTTTETGNRVTKPASRWEHFPHDADIGIRGIGATQESAFEQAATALTAAVTDPDDVAPLQLVEITCEARDIEFLLVEWLNALVYEMATQRMLFGRFSVEIRGKRLSARAWGEPIEAARHEPATEVKGATFTALKVARSPEGGWLAQCVVDV